MKKALVLLLHRAIETEAVKDGGPALIKEFCDALKRAHYSIDYISGNSMSPSKQYNDMPPFFQRIYKARKFAKEIDKNIFHEYDLIVFGHPSTVMGFEASDIPIEKSILFPTLLGKEYQHFMEVPQEYIELEKKILNYGYLVQSPSKSQINLLTKEYSVDEDRILFRPRGITPEIFPPKERELRKNISEQYPLRILSANAVRPQKGYIDLIPFVRFCTEKDVPLKIVIYGDTTQSTNKTYLEYAQRFIQEIRDYELDDFFEFHPAINQELLGREMDKVDISLVPSVYESFGKSALESSGSGLPTIVFDDVAVYREFLNDSCAIFSKRTTEDFYGKISGIISDPDTYEKLSIQGIKNGEKYINKEIYDSLLLSIEERFNIKRQ